jgi:uncharacterized membrane protein
MKNGKNKDDFGVRVIVASLYFISLVICILLVGPVSQAVFNEPNFLSITGFIFGIILILFLTIMFISTWESLFESEGDHQD